ncbi:MAG TPA: hypothetical protein VFM68_04435 [Candidatus Saccharimonadales bacterium]|nr:hypothetical protein [Candidatus Saccharimonadales bacterium]
MTKQPSTDDTSSSTEEESAEDLLPAGHTGCSTGPHAHLEIPQAILAMQLSMDRRH